MQHISPVVGRHIIARFLTVWVVAVLVGLAALTVPAVEKAQAAGIWGNCKTELGRWRKRGGYGAFAWSQKRARCGFISDTDDLASARRLALSACGKNCAILEELKTPSKQSSMNLACKNERGSTRLDACNWLVDSGKYKGDDLAFAHNGRGNAYQDMRQWDEALAAYDKAIAANRKHSWAHSNKGYVYEELGRYTDALANFRKGLDYFKPAKDCPAPKCDFREDVRKVVENIEKKLSEYQGKDDKTICEGALDFAVSQWSSYDKYAVFEARRRKYEIADCRVKLGRERLVNLYENQTDAGACSAALNATRDDWLALATEARRDVDRRGLTLRTCRVAMGLSPEPVSDKVLGDAKALAASVEEFAKPGNVFADGVAVARAFADLNAALKSQSEKDIADKTSSLMSVAMLDSKFVQFLDESDARSIEALAIGVVQQRSYLLSAGRYAEDYVKRNVTSDKVPGMLQLIETVQKAPPDAAAAELEALVKEADGIISQAGLSSVFQQARLESEKGSTEIIRALSESPGDARVLQDLSNRYVDTAWPLLLRQKAASAAAASGLDDGAVHTVRFGRYQTVPALERQVQRLKHFYPDVFGSVEFRVDQVNQSGAVNASALLSEKYKQRKARAVCMLLVAVTEQDCSVGGPN